MSATDRPHPEGLMRYASFSQVVIATGKRTIYTAGHVAIDERGALVGGDDLGAQAVQTMRNVGLALAAAGVAALALPGWLVEIEAVAVVD